MNVTLVAGARPNFVKIAPLIRAVERACDAGSQIEYRLVHTGQHFDRNMSGEFFSQLDIPEPHINLECGGGSQAEQTAAVLVAIERELSDNRPDVVVVVGDVNSTMASTIAAKKLCIPVVHVEAGIRSGDMTMPEEINRIVTDSICDHFFTTTRNAADRLRATGIGDDRIHFVGNTMIDTLMQNLDRFRKPACWDELCLTEKNYLLLTLHRPSNVDDAERLEGFLRAVDEGSQDGQVIFPVHPRTRRALNGLNLERTRLVPVDPLGYLEFGYLLRSAKAVITDSGGITEEATVLNVPCMTLRDSTERPETIELGTNELVGTDPRSLRPFLRKLAEGRWKSGSVPEFWDGHAAERIVGILLEQYGSSGSDQFASVRR